MRDGDQSFAGRPLLLRGEGQGRVERRDHSGQLQALEGAFRMGVG